MSIQLADMVATLRMNAGTLMKGITDAVSSVEDMGRSFSAQAASMGGLEKASANYIRSLERQAMAAGANKEAHLELKRVWDIIDYGQTEDAIKRIDAAYDKLADNLKKVQAAQTGFGDGSGATEAIQQFRGQLDSAAASAAKLGIALSASLTTTIVGLAKEAFQLGSSFQQAEIAFSTMLKSGEDAKVFLDELRNFAARTPFEFTDLLEASKRMMALGFAAQDVLPMMRSIGDAVSGLGGGKPLIDRITLALGQMRAATKVTQQDMMQLTNAGIGAWQILADKMNMTVVEVKKNASAGVISAAQAIPLILEGISEQFGNMMEKQTDTAEGQMSNFKDKMGFIMTDIGKTLIPFANMVLQNVMIPLLSMVEKVSKAFAELSFPMQGIIVTIAAVAAALGPALLAFAGLFTTVSSLAGFFGTAGFGATLAALASSVLPPLAVAVSAVAAAWLLWDIPAVRDGVKSLADAFGRFWTETLVPLGIEIKALGLTFIGLASDLISSGIETIWTGLKDLSSVLIQNFKDLKTGTDELGDSLSKFSELKPDSPLIDMLVMVGKLYAAIVHQGLIWATEAQIAVWKVVFTVVKELIDLSFKPLEAVIWLVTKAVDVLTGRMWLLAPAFKASFAPIELLVYAIKNIPGVAALVDKAFKDTGDAIDGFKAKLADTSAKLKDTGVDLNSPVQQLKKLREELVAAETNLGNIQKTFQETGKGALELAKAAEEVRLKKAAIGVAVTALEPTFQQLRKAVDLAKESYLAANKELAKVEDAFDKGKASTAAYAEAQTKAKAAQDTLKSAIATLNTVLKDAGVENSKYNGTLAEMKARWESSAKGAKSLSDQHKQLQAAVKDAEQNYHNLLKQYDAGQDVFDKLVKAYSRLQAAQKALDPAKHAAMQAKADSDIAESQEKLVKDIEAAKEKLKAADAQVAEGAKSTALHFAKAYNEIKETATKEIKIVVDSLSLIGPDGWVVLMALKAAKDIRDAYKGMGIATKEELKKTADEYTDWSEMIAEDAGTDSIAYKRAWITAEKARQEYLIASGHTISKEQKKALETAEKELDKSLGKQVSGWQKFGTQVSTIITDLGRDLAKAFIDLGKGLLGFDDFNDKIQEQQRQLADSLEARKAELDKFRQDSVQKEQDLIQQYAESLAAQEKALQDSLDERSNDYQAYANNIAAKMETIREDHANSLAKELHDLDIKLKDKEEAYEKYVYDVSRKEEEITVKYQENLDKQLASLQNSLDDRTQDLAEFVQDANKKLANIGKDLLESISDDQRSTDRKREDLTRNHNRKVQDLNKSLQEAIKKKDKEREAEIRLQLSREAEDHERTSRRIEEDFAEQVQDAKDRAKEQTDNLKDQLTKRFNDYKEFVDDTKKKEQEARSESAKGLAEDLKELQDNLAERTQELIKFRAETQRLRSEAIVANQADLDNELLALQDNLDAKTTEYEDFKRDASDKLIAITNTNALELEKATAKLHDELGVQLGEYDTFVAGVVAKITDLETQLKGPLDRIKELFGDVFGSAIEAVLRLGSEAVIGIVIKAFKDDLVGAVKAVGSALGDLLGITNNVVDSVSKLPKLPDWIPGSKPDVPTAPTGGGGGGIPGGGAAGWQGTADVITGAISAAANVVSAIYNVRIEGTLNAIEENTRRTAIIVEDTLNKANEWWPALSNINTSILGIVVPTLREIRDGIKTLFSVNINLTDEEQKQLFSSLITRVGHFDTTATDRLLEINVGIGAIVTAVQDARKSLVNTITSNTQLLVEGIAAVEDKLPSTVGRLLGGLSGIGGLASGIGSFAGTLISGLIRGEGSSADLTEENTRYTAIGIIGEGGVLDTLREYLPKLESLLDFENDIFQPWMVDVSTLLEQVNASVVSVHTRLGDILKKLPGVSDETPTTDSTQVKDQVTRLANTLTKPVDKPELEKLTSLLVSVNKLYDSIEKATELTTIAEAELKSAVVTLYGTIATGFSRLVAEDGKVLSQLSLISALIKKDIEDSIDGKELLKQVAGIETTLKTLGEEQSSRDNTLLGSVTKLVERIEYWGSRLVDLLMSLSATGKAASRRASEELPNDIVLPDFDKIEEAIATAVTPIADQLAKRSEDIRSAMQQIMDRVQAVRELATGDYTPSKELVELWTNTTKTAALEYNQLAMELAGLTGSLTESIKNESIADIKSQATDVYGLIHDQTNPLLSSIHQRLQSLPVDIASNPYNTEAAWKAIQLKLSLNGRSVGVAMTEDTDTLVPGI